MANSVHPKLLPPCSQTPERHWPRTCRPPVKVKQHRGGALAPQRLGDESDQNHHVVYRKNGPAFHAHEYRQDCRLEPKYEKGDLKYHHPMENQDFAACAASFNMPEAHVRQVVRMAK